MSSGCSIRADGLMVRDVCASTAAPPQPSQQAPALQLRQMLLGFDPPGLLGSFTLDAWNKGWCRRPLAWTYGPCGCPLVQETHPALWVPEVLVSYTLPEVTAPWCLLLLCHLAPHRGSLWSPWVLTALSLQGNCPRRSGSQGAPAGAGHVSTRVDSTLGPQNILLGPVDTPSAIWATLRLSPSQRAHTLGKGTASRVGSW